jgi:cysteine desulfurase
LEKNGKPVIYAPVSKEGIVDIDSVNKAITEGTELVSIMYANNEIGTIQPIKELATLAHEKGALFHTDAVQAVGHTTIDVHELDVDYLSASAHKFNGPKGIGFLYIKQGKEIKSLIDGGSQESGMRAGTENVAGIVGMSIALQNNCTCIEYNEQKLLYLEKILIDQLNNSGIDYIRNGGSEHIPGSISLSFPNIDGEMMLHRMDIMGICISTGSACDSQNTQISHVLRAINVPERYVEGTIRITLGKNNTEKEAFEIGNAIIDIVTANF